MTERDASRILDEALDVVRIPAPPFGLRQTERNESKSANRCLSRKVSLVPTVAWSLWRRNHQAQAMLAHYSAGWLTATASQEEVVPASEYRALQNQVKELQRMILATNDLHSYCISLSGSVEVFGVSGIFLLGGGAIDELVPSAALLLR